MYAIDFDNPWVAAVTVARRRVPATVLTGVATAFAAVILFTARSQAPALSESLNDAFPSASLIWRQALAGGVLQIAVFTPLLLMSFGASSWEHRSPWAATAQRWPVAPLGLLAGMFGLCASALISWAAGAIGVGGSAQTSAGSLVFGAALILLQASAEEVYFRGWLQPVLCVRWGPWLGLLTTSALFAGLHAINNAHGPLTLINLFLGGLFFGLLALRTGGLVAPIAAHFAWNWCESGVLGLDPSPTGSLLTLKLRGSPLWGGGVDLLDGSLAVTMVLTALIVALQLVKSRPRLAAERAG